MTPNLMFGILRFKSIMKPETIEQFYINFEKFKKDEWTSQQWYDYCSVVLCELMEEHYPKKGQ